MANPLTDGQAQKVDRDPYSAPLAYRRISCMDKEGKSLAMTSFMQCESIWQGAVHMEQTHRHGGHFRAVGEGSDKD